MAAAAIIVVSDLIKQRLKLGDIGADYLHEASQKANGDWDLPVSQKTLDYLQGRRVSGETFDNLVSRLIAAGSEPIAFRLDTTRTTRLRW